jgi:hypothetical protein
MNPAECGLITAPTPDIGSEAPQSGTSAASKAPSSSTARSGPSPRRTGTETTQRPASPFDGWTLVQRTDAARGSIDDRDLPGAATTDWIWHRRCAGREQATIASAAVAYV